MLNAGTLVRALAIAALPWGAAVTQEPRGSGTEEVSSAELLRIVAEQNELLRQLGARIAELEERLARVETGVPAGDPTPHPPATGSGVSEADLLAMTDEEQREQERLVRAAFERTLVERGSLLLPPGGLDIESTLSYVHSSSENILIDGFTILPVLVVGDIVSENIQRNLSMASVTGRVGLPWNTQLDVRIPYVHQAERRFTADNIESTNSASGFGDITFGISRQLARSGAWRPDLLASLRWKSTTGRDPFDAMERGVPAIGTGYDSLNLGLTAVHVLDPIVYFGSVSYSRNFAYREDIGRINPGNAFGASLGMAVALNPQSSLSFSYDQQFMRRTRVDGNRLPGSYLTTGMFTVGGSFAISDSLTSDVSLSIGLTSDSPDVRVTTSIPFRFRR